MDCQEAIIVLHRDRFEVWDSSGRIERPWLITNRADGGAQGERGQAATGRVLEHQAAVRGGVESAGGRRIGFWIGFPPLDIVGGDGYLRYR
jgi:hypothetical protein